MKKRLSCFLLATLVFVASAFAQCPGSMTASAVAADASCPSNGSATITTTPAANPSFTYTITAGPAGTLLNTPQASNVFNALLPGNYTVQVSCGATQTNTSFTIGNAYTPISNVNALVTATCGSYAPGGTVAISATGGSAPLSYSIVQSTDPNYSDALSVYNSLSNKTVTSFGTYQVRVKDACNQFYTSTVQVAPSLKPVLVYYGVFDTTSCNPTGYDFYYDVVDAATGAQLDVAAYNAAGGVKVNVYEQAAGSCGPAGPLLLTYTANKLPSHIRLPVVSSMKYFSQFITPCGDTTSKCYDATHVYDPIFAMWPNVNGCGSAGDPFIENIGAANWTAGIVYPLIVKLYQGSSTAGILIGTKTANSFHDPGNGVLNFNGLVPGVYYMTATDACGHTFNQLIDDPTAAGSPAFTFDYFNTVACSGAGVVTQSGTGSVVYTITGFLPGLSGATAIIISGPSGIGTSAYVTGTEFIWNNLLPGTYTADITTSCGVVTLQFVVPNLPNELLKQNISTTSSSTCGAGSGVVTATTDYNGALTPNYVLTNAVTNIGVDSNATGIFNSIAAGQYYVRLKLVNNTSCIQPVYYVNSNTVTIAASASGPQITKKLGIACEDAGGNLLITGSAYLSVAGASPFLIEYKLTSASTWVTFSSNASADSEIPGLTAGSIYDIRVTSCGITTATQVTVGKMGPVHATTNQQPCAGNPYELALPQLAGATYEWKNAAGNIISTAYNYTIASYNNSYNGVYTATTMWGSCAKRTDTITLNSLLCGSLISLPVKINSFTGKAQNCEVSLNWKTSGTYGITDISLQRSKNGREFTPIITIPSAAGDNYNYTDKTLQGGTVYYRLKTNTADGHFQYSNSISVATTCNSLKTQWSVYPSVVAPGSPVGVRLGTTDVSLSTASIVLISVTGQRAFAYDMAVHPGQNNYTLPDKKLVPGTYLLCVYDKQLLRIGGVQKLVYSR